MEPPPDANKPGLPSPQLQYATGVLRQTHRFEPWMFWAVWTFPALPHLLLYLTRGMAAAVLGPTSQVSHVDIWSSIVSTMANVTLLVVVAFPFAALFALVCGMGLLIRRSEKMQFDTDLQRQRSWVFRFIALFGLYVVSAIAFYSDPFNALNWLWD